MQKLSVIISLLLVCVCITVAGAESTSQSLSPSLTYLQERIDKLEKESILFKASHEHELETHLASISGLLAEIKERYADLTTILSIFLGLVAAITGMYAYTAHKSLAEAQGRLSDLKKESENTCNRFKEQIDEVKKRSKEAITSIKEHGDEYRESLKNDEKTSRRTTIKKINKHLEDIGRYLAVSSLSNSKIVQNENFTSQERLELSQIKETAELPDYIENNIIAAQSFATKKYRTAYKLYLQSNNLHPNLLTLCSAARSACHASLQHPEQSEKWLRNAIELYEKAQNQYGQLPERAYYNWAQAYSNLSDEDIPHETAIEYNNKSYETASIATHFFPTSSDLYDVMSSSRIGLYYLANTEADKAQCLAKAEKAAKKAHQIQENSSAYNLACIASLSNKLEEACDWLAKAIAQKDYPPTYDKLCSDKDLDNLRGEDCFKELLEQVRQREEKENKE